MRIGRKLLFAGIFGYILMSTIPAYSQVADSTKSITAETFFWTRERFVPKVGVSFQERTFVEIGVYWHNIYHHPLSLASKGPYASVDLMIDEKNLLVGPKLGYEFTAGIFGTALDVTYFFDKDYNAEGQDRRALHCSGSWTFFTGTRFPSQRLPFLPLAVIVFL